MSCHQTVTLWWAVKWKVLPRFELGSLDSKSRVLTITPKTWMEKTPGSILRHHIWSFMLYRRWTKAGWVDMECPTKNQVVSDDCSALYLNLGSPSAIFSVPVPSVLCPPLLPQMFVFLTLLCNSPTGWTRFLFPYSISLWFWWWCWNNQMFLVLDALSSNYIHLKAPRFMAWKTIGRADFNIDSLKGHTEEKKPVYLTSMILFSQYHDDECISMYLVTYKSVGATGTL